MFVFQQYTKSIFPWKTVLDNVRLAVKYLPNAARASSKSSVVPSWSLSASAAMATTIPISSPAACSSAWRSPGRWRGGRSLLMDEPFSALDAMMRVELQDLLLNLWEDLGLTILFVTHDLDEALYLAQRVIVLTASPGTIAEVVGVPLAYPRNQVETRSDPRYLIARAALPGHGRAGHGRTGGRVP